MFDASYYRRILNQANADKQTYGRQLKEAQAAGNASETARLNMEINMARQRANEAGADLGRATT